MRWGLPGPPQFGGAPVTNIRNVKSPHWRSVLGVAHRCLVPFTAFSEYEDASPKGRSRSGGLRRRIGACVFRRPLQNGLAITAQEEPNEGDHVLFSFLTTEANELVRPVHAKAMPVVLTDQAAREEWLNAPPDDIEAIQARVLPADA